MIPQQVKDKFQRLLRDAARGKLILVETKRQDGSEVYIIAYVLSSNPTHADVYPCAEMITGDPFKLYQTPEGALTIHQGKVIQ